MTKLHDNGTSTEMTVEGTEYNRRLLNIMSTTASDDSRYECMATNGLNPDVKQTFRLTVYGNKYIIVLLFLITLLMLTHL